MAAIEVTSASDPRLADYAGLRDRDLLRGTEGLFVGEQLLVVERMLALPDVVRSVLCAEQFRARVHPLVPPEVPLFVGSMELLRSLAGFHVHRGVLAIGVRDRVPRPSLETLAGAPAAARLLLACEDITHADNIGALFRVAAALGASGVLLSPRCHDPLYRRCVRMSVGHVLSVPWRMAETWPAELATLRQRYGFACLGASLDRAATRHAEVVAPRRTVLVMGAEWAGLSRSTVEVCDGLIRIPMAQGVDSLNVAVAAGILLDRLRGGG